MDRLFVVLASKIDPGASQTGKRRTSIFTNLPNVFNGFGARRVPGDCPNLGTASALRQSFLQFLASKMASKCSQKGTILKAKRYKKQNLKERKFKKNQTRAQIEPKWSPKWLPKGGTGTKKATRMVPRGSLERHWGPKSRHDQKTG